MRIAKFEPPRARRTLAEVRAQTRLDTEAVRPARPARAPALASPPRLIPPPLPRPVPQGPLPLSLRLAPQSEGPGGLPSWGHALAAPAYGQPLELELSTRNARQLGPLSVDLDGRPCGVDISYSDQRIDVRVPPETLKAQEPGEHLLRLHMEGIERRREPGSFALLRGEVVRAEAVPISRLARFGVGQVRLNVPAAAGRPRERPPELSVVRREVSVAVARGQPLQFVWAGHARPGPVLKMGQRVWAGVLPEGWSLEPHPNGRRLVTVDLSNPAVRREIVDGRLELELSSPDGGGVWRVWANLKP